MNCHDLKYMCMFSFLCTITSSMPLPSCFLGPITHPPTSVLAAALRVLLSGFKPTGINSFVLFPKTIPSVQLALYFDLHTSMPTRQKANNFTFVMCQVLSNIFISHSYYFTGEKLLIGWGGVRLRKKGLMRWPMLHGW